MTEEKRPITTSAGPTEALNSEMRMQHVLSGRNDPKVRLPYYYKEANI